VFTITNPVGENYSAIPSKNGMDNGLSNMSISGRGERNAPELSKQIGNLEYPV
jgi:hypothetical protein